MTELRKNLESIQEKHDEEISSLQTELEETTESKDHFETQYTNLLGRVNTIKTSLGDRLKADAVCAVSSVFFDIMNLCLWNTNVLAGQD